MNTHEFSSKQELNFEMGKTLISPDICVESNVTLLLGQEKWAAIQFSDELTKFILQKNINWAPAIRAFSHTRSNLMQRNIRASVVHVEDDFKTPVLLLKNESPNKVRIKKGTGVCNTVELREPPLTDDLLEKELSTRIHLSNSFWWPWIEGGKMIGLEFFVDPTIEYRVKKLTDELVLNGVTNGDHGRSEVDKMLEPVKPSPQPHFFVSELKTRFFIDKGIHGIIVPELHSSNGIQKIHAPSTLIRGEKTGSSPSEPNSIRIEVYGPSLEPDDRVRIQFYRA